MSEQQDFKITLRGYDRVAVDNFLARLQSEHAASLAELQGKVATLIQEQATIATGLRDGETLRGEMQAAMTDAQEFINSQSAKQKQTERELEEMRRKNALYLEKQEALTKLLADAQIKCSKLVEEAQLHAQRILAEAEKEKEAVLEKAQASAANIIGDSKRDADAVQTALRERFSTITDTVAAIRQLTGQVNACCDAADQMIAEPDSFFYVAPAEKEKELTAVK